MFQCILVLTLFLVIPVYVHAVTYYVDATSGNDGNTGTTIASPWKTIAKVNRSKFQPGDSILFRRDCTWREQLTIPSSGTAGNPITFGAYGTGEKPVISGADLVGVGGWTLYKGNIYVTTVGNITPPNQLYVDGTYYDMAHHPNSGWLLTMANSTDTTTITDANLSLTANQVLGSTVMIRVVPWNISKTTATGYESSSHIIKLNNTVFSSSVMRTGYGYYLQNKLWMLDSPGEWFYDSATGKLYLWTKEGDNPSKHTVEISNRLYAISNNGGKYITIQDLTISKAAQDDLYVMGANYLIVNNLDVSGGIIGIHISCTNNSSIQNNFVKDTLSNGLDVSYYVNNINISSNTVNNAGNTGLSPKQSKGGINIVGTAITVNNNSIIESGYNGIAYYGDQITLQNNYINRSCLVLDDCGGIYTWGSGNNIITGNTISNSIGNLNGTNNKFTQAQGIYLDDFVHNTTVSNNVVSNTDYGIFVHTGYSNIVTSNTVYGARMNALLINENSTGALPGAVHDNVVTNNIFETISAGATAYYYSTIDTATNFGRYDFNRYYRPNSEFVIQNQSKKYSLYDWQKASGQDYHSTDTKSYAPRTVTPAPSNLRIKY